MHGPVIVLVEAGEITPRARKTADDLDLAATWLESYEGDTEDDKPNLVALATVAESLRKQAARRRGESA